MRSDHFTEKGWEVKKNPAAVSLGRRGGKVTSEAKAIAARLNGRKGGRPKKSAAPFADLPESRKRDAALDRWRRSGA